MLCDMFDVNSASMARLPRDRLEKGAGYLEPGYPVQFTATPDFQIPTI